MLFRFISLLMLAAVFSTSSRAAETSPNMIIIVADDLGYGDLSSYGHPSIRTPNLDKMLAGGLRLSSFYAGASLCTPSRAAMLTGRLPIRSGMAGGPGRHVLYPNDKGGLPKEEITIARALKTKGYSTACFGKWHLGDQPGFLPTDHGFDRFFGIPYSNDMDAVSKKLRAEGSDGQNPKSEHFNVPLIRQTNIIERPVQQETLTKRLTEEAIGFIKENKSRPFFLYMPHPMPHVPLFASKEFKGKSARGLYGDTVEELDWSVGELLKTLRAQGLETNTLVFFTSDNGPWLPRKLNGGSGGLFRDGKGGTWEGGYRVPAIAYWPGKIKAGGMTTELASAMDLFNTCLKLARVEIPKDRPVDGVDLAPLLFENRPSPRKVQFLYYGDQLYAVRKGPFKAHFVTHDGYSKDPAVKYDVPLLFQVQEDPSESVNVADKHPKIVADLTREFEKHKAEVTAGKPQF